MSEPGYESSGCKRSVGTKRLDTPCTPIRKSKRFSAFAVFSFVLIWHDFFSFLCLFVFHVSFFFLVHTSPILPFQKNVTKAREKQVNKRKTGNEYEKFSLLYVNMVRLKKKKRHLLLSTVTLYTHAISHVQTSASFRDLLLLESHFDGLVLIAVSV